MKGIIIVIKISDIIFFWERIVFLVGEGFFILVGIFGFGIIFFLGIWKDYKIYL